MTCKSFANFILNYLQLQSIRMYCARGACRTDLLVFEDELKVTQLNSVWGGFTSATPHVSFVAFARDFNRIKKVIMLKVSVILE